MKRFFINSVFAFMFCSLNATITLPTLISDNMVLQQGKLVTIWGWTSVSDETIKVSASWNSKDTSSVQAVAGKWKVQIFTPTHGGPYTLCIKGHETKIINNVMIGEVWMACGQSNMAFVISMLKNSSLGNDYYNDILAKANYPKIRMFNVQKIASSTPQDNCPGSAWQLTTPTTVDKFSAVCYFFAKSIHDSLSVPVGIINSSWGGSNAESWVNGDSVTLNQKLYDSYKKLIGNGWDTIPPGQNYNGMIYPTENYCIKGALYYQGESNKENASTYTELLSKLISSWRISRKEEFPFYMVQITPYTQAGVTSMDIRDAQRRLLSIQKTGLVVTSDFSDITLLHPPQKEEVGRRLSLWSLANDYGKKISFSGPQYKSMKIFGDKISVKFDYAEGLNTQVKELYNFQIAGETHFYEPATAVISGDSIIVSNPKISKPIAVRFAYSDFPENQLYNSAGLPASIFRTDTLGYSGPPINNIYISPNGNDSIANGLIDNPYRTLIRAYAVAKENDTIRIMSGLYKTSSTLTYLPIVKSITLLGENAENCILQATDSSVVQRKKDNGRFASLTSEGKTLNIENLTFKNFGFWNSTENGGVINVGMAAPKQACTLNVKRCNFIDNAAHSGGAIEVLASAAISKIEDSYFYQNYAMPSSAILGVYYADSIGYGGGAVDVVRNSLLTMRNSIFYKNGTIDNPLNISIAGKASTGRAVNCSSTTSKYSSITNCTFVDNYALGVAAKTITSAIAHTASTQPLKFINNLIVNSIPADNTASSDFRTTSSTVSTLNFKGNVLSKISFKNGFVIDPSNSIDATLTKTSTAIGFYKSDNLIVVNNQYGIGTLIPNGIKIIGKGVSDIDVANNDINGLFRGTSIDIGAVQFNGFPTAIHEISAQRTSISIVNKTIQMHLNNASEVSVFDIIGKNVFSSKKSCSVTIPIQKSGVYLIKISNKFSDEWQKLLIH